MAFVVFEKSGGDSPLPFIPKETIRRARKRVPGSTRLFLRFSLIREGGARTQRYSTLAFSRIVLSWACSVCLAKAWVSWGLTLSIAGAVKGR
jgi:hypothetical protein